MLSPACTTTTSTWATLLGRPFPPVIVVREKSPFHGMDKLTRRLLEETAKSCPRCGAWVERNGGCDHMTCWCGGEFCYRCGQDYPACQCCNEWVEAERRQQEEEQRELDAEDASPFTAQAIWEAQKLPVVRSWKDERLKSKTRGGSGGSGGGGKVEPKGATTTGDGHHPNIRKHAKRQKAKRVVIRQLECCTA